jgi:uncharacterized protein (UPF0212 family)
MESKSQTVPVGYIDISLAERMINRYDGNKSNLHVFLDNCNNAYSLLNPNFRLAFVSIALSKIDGNLRSTLLNRSFNSWIDLKNHLLETYSEKRTFAQWQLELNSCKQGHNENVLNYSNRIENCYIKLIKSLDQNLTKEAREANVELLKRQALNIFISGLNPQLHILLKSQKPNNFEEAISVAISEEQEIKSRHEMTSKRYENNIKRCSKCNMNGHLAFQCRNNVVRSVQTIPTCFNCGKKGHLARDCWHTPGKSQQHFNTNVHRNNNNYNPTYQRNHQGTLNKHLNSTSPKTTTGPRTR